MLACFRVAPTPPTPQALENTLSITLLRPPPTPDSFLFIISSDSRGNDGEWQKAFCQFLSA